MFLFMIWCMVRFFECLICVCVILFVKCLFFVFRVEIRFLWFWFCFCWFVCVFFVVCFVLYRFKCMNWVILLNILLRMFINFVLFRDVVIWRWNVWLLFKNFMCLVLFLVFWGCWLMWWSFLELILFVVIVVIWGLSSNCNLNMFCMDFRVIGVMINLCCGRGVINFDWVNWVKVVCVVVWL